MEKDTVEVMRRASMRAGCAWQPATCAFWAREAEIKAAMGIAYTAEPQLHNEEDPCGECEECTRWVAEPEVA